MKVDGLSQENAELRALVDGLGIENLELRTQLLGFKHNKQHEVVKFVRQKFKKLYFVEGVG